MKNKREKVQEQKEEEIEGEEEGNKPPAEAGITAAIAPITHIVKHGVAWYSVVALGATTRPLTSTRSVKCFVITNTEACSVNAGCPYIHLLSVVTILTMLAIL